MRRAGLAGLLAGLAALPALAVPASGAVPHTVLPGETLWGIAAANNFTTRTVAAFNGLTEDSQVIAGQTIQIPTVTEGAAALAEVGLIGGGETTSSAPASSEVSTIFDPSVVASAPGMGHVPSPWGLLHLAPAAADAWNAMRAESLRLYGTDLYPNGPLSAYRTWEQQSYLYDLFLSGQGAPANPPGSSSHETGYAVDLAHPDMRWVIDQIGAQFCWGKVHAPSEWWHVDYLC